MRPVMVGDLLCLARLLYRVPSPDRPSICANLLQQTEAADKYRKRLGRVHPLWGNGSLMARAVLADSKALCHISSSDPEMCDALQTVLTHLAVWRALKAQRGASRSRFPNDNKEFNRKQRPKANPPLHSEL